MDSAALGADIQARADSAPFTHGHHEGPSVISRQAIAISAALLAPSVRETPRAPTCPEPYRVSRQELLEAMGTHGAYSLTSTTTSTRFGAEALLALVRRRQQQ